MTTDAPPPAGLLPESLQAIADAVGLDLALRLSAVLGGQRVWVRDPDGTDALSRALGPADAAVMAAALGPGWLKVPKCAALKAAARGARIVAARAAGQKIAEIARAECLTEEGVYLWLRKARAARSSPTA
jgi:hypothetical protein